ncbi:MAG TPA: 30S ribosomal protein S16 [Bacteroidota bacterium]|nr:30S ribosomal protein S16 [Bacteroidota bacterium]
MVKIRLRRVGKKAYAVYKLVATDIRKPRNGGYLEAVGQYNPNLRPLRLSLNETRIEYWLKRGAQPTDTVRSLLRRQGFWLKWTLMRQGKDEATIAKVVERWQMQQVDRDKREADRKARRAEKKKKAAPAPEKPAAPPAEAPAAPAASA